MPPPRRSVATIGTRAAVVTADSQVALSVTSRTPKARATGDMALPAMEIDWPPRNHRKAAERSGRPDATPPISDIGSASLSGGSGSRLSGMSVAGTRGHRASARGKPQVVFAGLRHRVSVTSTRGYGGSMASIKQFQVTFDCAEP